MVQDYLAFIIFLGALIFSGFSLIRYLVKFRKQQGGACGGACSCEEKKAHKLLPEYLKNRTHDYKQVRLK